MDKIRVLIVDDHAVVRQGLRTFLELQGDAAELPLQVVGEADDGKKAVEFCRELKPDIMLLDLVMPEMDGISATPLILAASPATRVIILTSFGEEDKVLPAIRAGAQGYLLKDIPPDDLVKAVRAAYRGEVQLHPSVAKKLMSTVAAEKPAGKVEKVSGEVDLSAREMEVLQQIAGGKSNHEIAEKLVISEKTVKTHVSSIFLKLNVQDRTQAAIYAIKHGMVEDDS